MNKPTVSCHRKTGAKLTNPNVQSVCNNGDATSCTNNKPFKVSESLSMGFAAVGAAKGTYGLDGDNTCGRCFELQFVDKIHVNTNKDKWGGSHRDLVGKTMIVQVTNIGGDVTGDHSFDIQIPAAGQGIYKTGCARQFPGKKVGDFDCDNDRGGCKNKSGCSRLPQSLRSGCEWRYDWYKWLQGGTGKTNNPYVKFRRVRCPAKLTAISGSIPNDDAKFPPHSAASIA